MALFFAAGIRFRHGIRRRQFFQQSLGMHAAFFAEFIVCPFSRPDGFRQCPIPPKSSCDTKVPIVPTSTCSNKNTGTFLSAPQQFENHQAVCVAKSALNTFAYSS
jgi:hypothetical protein